jgi:hypothetical protein
MRHWQPLRAIYRIASSTARKSVSRGRPKRLGAGIKGAITAQKRAARHNCLRE